MMKNLFLFSLLLCFQTGFGQSTKFSVYANSGTSSFKGGGALKSAEYYTGGPWCMCDENDPMAFGAKRAVSYGAGLNFERVFKNNFLAGLELGYEVLRTRASITNFVLDDMIFRVSGKNINVNHFVNAFPHAGYQFPKLDQITFALSAGADFGFGLDSYDKASIPDFLKKSYRNTDNILALDFRPRVHLSASFNRFALTAGYAYGLSDWAHSNSSASLSVIRMGLQYRLN